MDKKIWTILEDQYIKENYAKTSINEICSYLNCSTATFYKRVKELGLFIEKKPIWTKEKVKFLKDNLENMSIDTISEEINISKYYIKQKIKELDLKTDKWTNEEIEILKELVKTLDYKDISKKLGRSENAIKSKTSRLGLDTIYKRIEFSKEEIEFIKSNWGVIPVADIARTLKVTRQIVYTQAKKLNLKNNGRKVFEKWDSESIEKLRELSTIKTISELATYFKTTNKAISNIAYKNHIKLIKSKSRWTQQQEQLLLDNYENMNIKELSNLIGIGTTAIRSKLNRLGLKHKNTVYVRKNWTKEEVEFLKSKVKTQVSLKEIADALNRTEDSVYKKAKKLDLNLLLDRRNWTKEEETLLSDLWGYKPIEQIAKKLNRSVSSIRNKAFLLKLGPQKENYEVLNINTICELFNQTYEVVTIFWVALGLKLKTRYITKSTSYKYVDMDDLFEFLKTNQNIWDSRVLERNILGIEPEWLKEKRKRDVNMPKNSFDIDRLSKKQLLKVRKSLDNTELESGFVKKIDKGE